MISRTRTRVCLNAVGRGLWVEDRGSWVWVNVVGKKKVFQKTKNIKN